MPRDGRVERPCFSPSLSCVDVLEPRTFEEFLTILASPLSSCGYSSSRTVLVSRPVLAVK